MEQTTCQVVNSFYKHQCLSCKINKHGKLQTVSVQFHKVLFAHTARKFNISEQAEKKHSLEWDNEATQMPTHDTETCGSQRQTIYTWRCK